MDCAEAARGASAANAAAARVRKRITQCSGRRDSYFLKNAGREAPRKPVAPDRPPFEG